MIWNVHPGSQIQIFSHTGSRTLGSKKHRIPDPRSRSETLRKRLYQQTKKNIIYFYIVLIVPDIVTEYIVLYKENNPGTDPTPFSYKFLPPFCNLNVMNCGSETFVEIHLEM
jgi:hypothetical protein